MSKQPPLFWYVHIKYKSENKSFYINQKKNTF